jgi:hypothetical protein
LKVDVSWYETGRVARELRQFPRPLELRQFRVRYAEAGPDEIRRLRGLIWGRTPARFGLRRPLEWGGLSRRSYVPEAVEVFDPRYLQLPDDVYLDGYWQSPHYFREIEAQIRQEFELADSGVAEAAEEYLGPYRQAGRPLVALHVRRGDMAFAHEVVKKPVLMYGPPATAGYFSTAMRHFPGDTTFLVFSDGDRDLDWCQENLRGAKQVFVRGNPAIVDFAIMQRCDHSIISNSSFSWWAAWLNRNPVKQVIAPRRWFYENGVPRSPLEYLIPRDWTLVEA